MTQATGITYVMAKYYILFCNKFPLLLKKTFYDFATCKHCQQRVYSSSAVNKVYPVGLIAKKQSEGVGFC